MFPVELCTYLWGSAAFYMHAYVYGARLWSFTAQAQRQKLLFDSVTLARLVLFLPNGGCFMKVCLMLPFSFLFCVIFS
jgi:hypothetical protein